MHPVISERTSKDKSGSHQARAYGEAGVVVGIGASAGGIESLEQFFAACPLDTGFAFVVVQHLPMDFKSSLDNILRRSTGMLVEKIKDGTLAEPDTVYLSPANKKTIFSSGRFYLSDWKLEETKTAHYPIDHCLSSLAEELGPRGAGIILSGTGSDGSKGVSRIQEAGGFVLVESTETALFGAMPNNANSLGTVGSMLTPEAMSPALVEHFSSVVTQVVLHPDDGAECSEQIGVIFDLLKTQSGIDFHQYRISTLERRIQNRMVKTQIDGMDDYVRVLGSDSDEVEMLYRDLLIGVTQFFRDPEAFEVLKEAVIPQLLKGRSPDDEIRIWVVACATGEEAYSLAILLYECCEKIPNSPDFKIFATDVHQISIQTAATGVYSRESLLGMSEERVNRFFVRETDGFHIVPEIRQHVIFAQQNILKDPPFARMDLVSCRNMLIYFKQLAQQKILSLFLFSLRENGILFLGPSEALGGLSNQLLPLDTHWNIYRCDGNAPPNAMLIPPETRQKIAKLKARSHQIAPPVGFQSSLDMKLGRTYEYLLDSYVPPSILIDEKNHLVQTIGNCQKFMKPSSGPVSLNVLDMVNDKLKLAISGSLQRARNKKKITTYNNLELNIGDERVTMNVVVDPIAAGRSQNGYTHIAFVQTRAEHLDASLTPVEESNVSNQDSEDLNEVLSKELISTREHLQSTVEELEASNEELQATNEEMLTSNEELQSTNEELHSVNEELFTVNSEYELKNEELLSLNTDINNLLRSTAIGTVFIDKNMRIRKYTPAIAESLNLIPEDIERPIEHITHKFPGYDRLSEDIAQVIETNAKVELEVKNENSKWFLLRILPYQGENEEHGGAVLTFIDINALKEAEEALHSHQRRLDLALESANLGVWSWELKSDKLHFDERFENVLGLSLDKIESAESLFNLLKNHGEASPRNAFTQAIQDGKSIQHTWDITLKDGQIRYVSGRGMVMRNEAEGAVSLNGVIWDESEVKQQEQTVLQKKRDLETLLYVISHDLREPLRAIRNFSQFISEGHAESMDNKGRDYLKRIELGSSRMESLLNDVLELSRLQKMVEPTNEIPGNELVESALNSLESKIQESGANITIAKELPHLRVDPTWAKQAIFNLISNALKFVSVEQAPEITITPYVPPRQPSRYVGIVVQDRGPGIPPDSVERIFKLFQRAVGREIEGTGAGLAIVKEVVSKHGGEVFYEPRAGGGSKFTMTFLK